MRSGHVLFSSASEAWATPKNVYDALNQEFSFTLDPCPLLDPSEAGMPLFGADGLYKSWSGHRVFCNPPYGKGIAAWLVKSQEAEVAVYLLPSRTDTAWWHDHAMRADEIRFLRGRLRFGESKNSAPFPSVVLVYRSAKTRIYNA